ncbi:hypothetical protein RA086_12210 [Lactiplantibacillus sp. WILCCON 0030]|uniref:Bacteriocin immunity protein n=1 Tax=Lactiplantibacillus brownii TaxID=3069269 RepID=A0ABU1ADB8_9LACO|nr:hypothetical protein [Lactiplantibacillus brownii]MDQ7938373.1 hypothetical protein [Lactiplantibacillus brownii]
MEEQRQKLTTLVDRAYEQVQLPKFDKVSQQLAQFSKALNHDEDYIKIMLGLRTALLQADLSLNIKNRIAGLPAEHRDIYDFIAPQLKQVDAKVLDRYTHYGFIPLKFGSTVKYS